MKGLDSGKSRLRRDLVIALAVKLVLLAVLYELFFAPRLRPPQNAAATATALLGNAQEDAAQ